MNRPRRLILYAVGGLISLLLLTAIALLFFVDANAYKTRLEAAASEILGLEVRVGGRVGIGIYPGLLVTLEDVHIRNQGVELVAARQARLGIGLLSLIRQEVRIEEIVLRRPRISIERNRDGIFNFERPETAEGGRPALDLEKVSISGGTLLYADRQYAQGFEASNCNLAMHRLRLAGGKGQDYTKSLSFTAELACEAIQKNDVIVSDVKLSANAKNGIFLLKPVLMRIFGGQGTGSIRADLAGAVPIYEISYSLSQFNVDEFLRTLSPDKVAEGTMDFSMNLSMQGRTANEMKQTAEGKVSLRGANLTLIGYDLDGEFSRYESSQNFNLVDVGAFFFAGPVGLAVTKGYNFASIFKGSGGRSEIRTLVSDWTVEHGVMQAQDVALATRKNRVALQGGTDFVNARFNNVAVALIDAKGCATVRQKISGSFQKPLVEKPNVLTTLAGPAVTLLKKGRGLLPGGKCKPFYTGSIVP